MSEPSDATMRKAWREAVFAVWGDACILCGARPVSPHHVVKRSNGVLKWDVKNGRPLCALHHHDIEQYRGEIPLTEYLRDFAKWNLADWIAAQNQRSAPYTREMFLNDELAELRTAIMNPIPYRSEE